MAERAAGEKAECGEAAFVPITLKASPVEIEFPNGGAGRLPLGGGMPRRAPLLMGYWTLASESQVANEPHSQSVSSIGGKCAITRR